MNTCSILKFKMPAVLKFIIGLNSNFRKFIFLQINSHFHNYFVPFLLCYFLYVFYFSISIRKIEVLGQHFFTLFAKNTYTSFLSFRVFLFAKVIFKAIVNCKKKKKSLSLE